MIRPEKHFSFEENARGFDAHIKSSIPGYKSGLLPACVGLSRRFVQPGTRVIDIGCSTGHLLASIRRANRAARPDVEYIGIDIVPSFSVHWDRLSSKNIRFNVADARTFQDMSNVSLAVSSFFIQFIRPMDKMSMLKRIYAGLVDGGALIIAEKTLAGSARAQDAMTFPYYDYKLRKGIDAQQILDKERCLRGQMTLWTENELRAALSSVGFDEIEPVWRDQVFVGLLALKGTGIHAAGDAKK